MKLFLPVWLPNKFSLLKWKTKYRRVSPGVSDTQHRLTDGWSEPPQFLIISSSFQQVGQGHRWVWQAFSWGHTFIPVFSCNGFTNLSNLNVRRHSCINHKMEKIFLIYFESFSKEKHSFPEGKKLQNITTMKQREQLELCVQQINTHETNNLSQQHYLNFNRWLNPQRAESA